MSRSLASETFPDRPFHGSALLEGDLVQAGFRPPGGKLCGGLLAGLDLAGTEHLELGREQRDAADLFQVGADRIGRLGIAVPARERARRYGDQARGAGGRLALAPGWDRRKEASTATSLRSARSGSARSLWAMAEVSSVATLSVGNPVTLDVGACSVVPVISPPDRAATATLPIDSQPHLRRVRPLAGSRLLHDL